MKIAFLSGKGGTGKTTLSNNLAALIPGATLIDCDVEEPNSHIFMKPRIDKEDDLNIEYPVIDEEKCNACGECGRFCKYHALLCGKGLVIPLKEMCHSCGGCKLVCPQGAISYQTRPIGKIYRGTSRENLSFVYGVLNVGELSGVKIINQVKEFVAKDRLVFIDSPPGTSCATVAAVEDSDYAIIVTEPTPFGVSDMKMVVEMLRKMKIPMGVIVNKAGMGDDEIYDYCKNENLTIVGEVPFYRSMAEAYSEGILSVDIPDSTEGSFRDLYQNLVNNLLKQKEVAYEY